MKLFKWLNERREVDRAATENSKALLQDALDSDPHIEEMHRTAVSQLQRATEQARKLSATDYQNHYSESLTHAFRGKTA